MIFPNIEPACEQAKLYYYDYLFQEDKTNIPENVLNHIKICRDCQDQINQLNTTLIQTNLSIPVQAEQPKTTLSNILSNHFSYVDQEITCKEVKPFLPGLIDSAIQINIPTPITAHLDNCPECVNDLKKISDLGLNNENLSKLSRILAEKDENDDVSCSIAKSDIMAFVMMVFGESNEHNLNHLCTCSTCSKHIYQYRESIRKELLTEAKSCSLSIGLSNDELFDFVFPYELDITTFNKSDIIKSRISHIRRCPACLGKLQELHNIVHDIKARNNSSTITKYTLEESNQAAEEISSQKLYEGYPVHVEVSGAYEHASMVNSGSNINFTTAKKRKILTKNVRTLYKTGFTGILLLAALLTAALYFSPNAEAYNLSEFYSSIRKVQNVYIASYTTNDNKLIQEEWISSSANMKIQRTNDKMTLLDLDKGYTKTKIDGSELASTQKISKEMQSDSKININTSLWLNPDMLPKSQWNKIAENTDTEVYELLYSNKSLAGAIVSVRLVYTIKIDSGLPVKVEFYQKLPNEEKYELGTYKTIKYLQDQEFNDIKSSFFDN